MTTDLEKRFFDTFGIEPKKLIFRTMNCACGCHDCENCEKYKNKFSKTYPQITDRILLELICILATHLKNIECCHLVIAENIETLKRHTLNDCIDYAKDIKHQVQALFKED